MNGERIKQRDFLSSSYQSSGTTLRNILDVILFYFKLKQSYGKMFK